MMLYMLLVKASQNSEGNNLPNPSLMKLMDDYNDALEAAGVKVMAKGLKPSSFGIRYMFQDPSKPPVKVKGPFSPVSTVIAGFFLLDVQSQEEAENWASRCPDPQGNGEGEIELRPLY
jgi:hypothetical protein